MSDMTEPDSTSIGRAGNFSDQNGQEAPARHTKKAKAGEPGSNTNSSTEDGSVYDTNRKGRFRDWLSDLFSDEPDDLPELMEIVSHAADRDLIDTHALNIIFGAMHVADMHARDIMIPRSGLVVVHEDQEPKDLLPLVIESRHSRFPVVGDDMDDVKGILHAKDLLPLVLETDHQKFSMRDCIRPATVVPESKRLNVLLQEFRATHNHMAVVVDEYGQLSGAVTIEDVLEQIVGEIEDEHDIEDDHAITQIEPHGFNVKASVAIDDFNEYFGTNLSEEEFDTVGGIVLHAFGHLPERGEVAELQSLRFEVLNADSRRLRLLRVHTPQ
ncbi:MAG: transporter associated domain-containing protein [Pseudomonadota bacterium]